MSPFPGIKEGSDMEKKLDSCIEAVMKQHEGEEDFGKSNAVAICRESLKASDESHGVVLEPITARELAQYGDHALFANIEPGTLLRFKNAHLCSAGENRNRDWIDKAGVKELADTMHFRAIDDEHDPQKVIGFFVNPRAEDNSTRLITDGIIYADRFSKIAAQVQNGSKKLSVEAGAQKAVCSVCAEEFTAVRDYCEHLKDKPRYGAVRKLYGLKAKGGATVFHPAYDTSFDENGFVMIASELDCGCEQKEVVEEETKEPTGVAYLKAWVEKKLTPVMEANVDNPEEYLEEETVAEKEKVDAKDKDMKDEESKEEEVDAKEEKGTKEKEKELKNLKAEVETLKTENEELKAKVIEVQAGFERAIELSMGADQAPILGGLEEDEYALFKRQRDEVKVEAPVVEEEEEVEAGQLQGQLLSTTEGTDNKLTLANLATFLSAKSIKKEVK